MDYCPCGIEKEFSACCEPLIRKQTQPESAEALMRSRFSAYARGHIDYLVYSHDPETRSASLRSAVREWARKAEFKALRILNSTQGAQSDAVGTVHFEADYIENGQTKTLSEVSEFRQYAGRWVYSRGSAPKPPTVVRTDAKVGRNDPCPCGSGKKYKKCCG